MKLHYAGGKTKDVVDIEALVAFAQAQVTRIQHDRDNLNVAYDTVTARQPMSPADIEKAREFERIDWLRQGEQLALRNVVEWAKEQAHAEPVGSQEDFKNQIDGVSHV